MFRKVFESAESEYLKWLKSPKSYGFRSASAGMFSGISVNKKDYDNHLRDGYKRYLEYNKELKTLKSRKVRLLSKALKMMPNSPKQLKIREEIKDTQSKIDEIEFNLDLYK